MLRIDVSILATSKVICENISYFSFSDRGLLSQNILAQIRNLVEYVAMRAVSNANDIDPNDYDLRKLALKDMQKRGNLRFLYKFHEMLQKSVSHYTVDKNGSERLMLKYYEYLLKIKMFLKQNFDLDILENIQDFPLNTDNEIAGYYEKIAEKIESSSPLSYPVSYRERYYIQRVKPFFVKQKVYYEITFTDANANVSKFNRAIAFTKHEIIDNYAVKVSIHNDFIQILGKNVSIMILDNYEVSIRPCEWNNLSNILGLQIKYSSSSDEYKRMMRFLTDTKMSLTELVSVDDYYYDCVKRKIMEKSRSSIIYTLLDQCRDIILRDVAGSNILRYLLYKMNNRIIKQQMWNNSCEHLSNLHLNYACIPFERMPYCTSLRKHNPRIYDLFDSIPIIGHEHELFARYIKNNTETEGRLFTPTSNLSHLDNIEKTIQKYNNLLYHKHEYRQLKRFKDFIYVAEYIDDITEIIAKLQELSSTGVSHYAASVNYWISQNPYDIDDQSKIDALCKMFSSSHVALIYGAAGTGKSTLLKHVADFWADKSKLFLANTHPAVDNMRRKVSTGNSTYSTIAKFLSQKNIMDDYDILIIDECSTVSNNDMRKVLDKSRFKLFVLVGDIYQIESIYFGNWFNLAQKFVHKDAIFELSHPYRTQNDNLLTVWERVRKLDDSILEILVKNGYVANLDETIFEIGDDDEIILCLNYDGLYGINNINRFLQNNNPNKGVIWGINTYKIGDPVLFNDANIFSPLIHNNTKGRIVEIHADEYQILFNVEIENSINAIDAEGYEFQLIGESEKGNSIISFSVNKFRSTDEDDYSDSTIVPFQVAYAVSIHKAQGLEYDSVKIVITNEIEEQITHNIFYTAITRAKNKLKIYWSPETEHAILERMKINDTKKDAYLLANLSALKMA